MSYLSIIKNDQYILTHNNDYVIRFSNEVSKEFNKKHKKAILQEYEIYEEDNKYVKSDNIKNAIPLYSLNTIIDKIKDELLDCIEYAFTKDEEDDLTIDDLKIEFYEFLNKKKLSMVKFGSNNSENKRIFINKIKTWLIYHPLFTTFLNTNLKEEELSIEDALEKANKLYNNFFKDKTILSNKVINDLFEAIRFIVSEDWLLNDFNQGNILFYMEDEEIELLSKINEPEKINKFFEENLKIKLIDWKYVSTPEKNIKEKFDRWDNSSIYAGISNMISMKGNIQRLRPELFGSTSDLIEKLEKMIYMKQRQIITGGSGEKVDSHTKTYSFVYFYLLIFALMIAIISIFTFTLYQFHKHIKHGGNTYKLGADDMIILPAGKILYLGTKEHTEQCPLTIEYEGQESLYKGKDDDIMKHILYTTNDENTAERYATCFSCRSGWVKKYVIKKNLILPNISDDLLHYDADEVKKEFCDQNGYYLKWSNNPLVEEIVICKPTEYLKYIGAKQCLGHGKFSDYKCN